MAMQANLEAMIDGVMPADFEHLVTVNSEVLRLGRLVEAQLKLSRLEARMVEAHPRRLDLEKLIARLISNYRLLVEDSGLVLDFAADTGVFIYADPDMIRQAVANLLSNAIRYTPEGGRIRVVVRKQGNRAELEVADTGIGIGEDDLDTIFNKFQRVGSNPTSDAGGLGIGLAMVREIINIHKGTIAVTSQLGLGSSFTISLPLSE
jgi:signal transduction histidine kinase